MRRMQKRASLVRAGLIVVIGVYLLASIWSGPFSGAVTMTGCVRVNEFEPHRVATESRQPDVRESVGKSR